MEPRCSGRTMLKRWLTNATLFHQWSDNHYDSLGLVLIYWSYGVKDTLTHLNVPSVAESAHLLQTQKGGAALLEQDCQKDRRECRNT